MSGVKGAGSVPIKDSLPVAPFEWLLRDEFTDVRAAGAVNATPATPGPGTRTVVDTDVDALLIAGGQCVFQNPNAASADPGLWYEIQPRIAGRMLLISVVASTAGIYTIGWGPDQVTLADLDAFRFSNGNWFVMSNGATGPRVGIFANTVTYAVVVILRASGSYLLVKGGAFTDWTLLYVESVNATANVYPGVTTFSGAFLLDWARIPAHLYLPTPLAYDTFTRANGPLGNTEGTGPDGQAVSARAWTNRVGTTLIAGNAASASALVGGIAIATVTTPAADVIAQATLARAGGDVGVVLRYADAINYVIGYHDGVNARLDKIVGGVTTNVITAAVAIGAGAIAIICEDTQFSLFLNNAKVGVTGTINDAALQNGTEQGLYSTNVGNTQDVFLDMPRGTNGEYAGLDKYSG